MNRQRTARTGHDTESRLNSTACTDNTFYINQNNPIEVTPYSEETKNNNDSFEDSFDEDDQQDQLDEVSVSIDDSSSAGMTHQGNKLDMRL